VGKLVEVIGVSHNPFFPRLFAAPDPHPGIARVRECFEDMRRRLAAAEPDVILAIGGDHLNQWFMDNMPAFLIGKSPTADGPFPHESDEWGMPSYHARVDVDTARTLIAAGFDHGVDFGYSDEFLMDHSITQPLAYIRPEMDLPIVPIFSNVMALPVPPPKRFYQVGLALRNIIDDQLPANLRVAAIASGHLSVEVGGPRAKPDTIDEAFDHQAVELLASGDVDRLLTEITWQRLMEAGNVSYGFATYLILVGLVRGIPATHTEAVKSSTNTAPFWTWDLYDVETA
jgi:protocatechuate 4,5-dioxygenase beta chain